MRGQIKVEFILAIVAFSAVAFAIAIQINSTANIVASDSRADALKTKAAGVLSLLLEDEKWLALNGKPYSINMVNLTGINSTRGGFNQCTLLEPFDLGGYRLTIASSTSTLLRCGALGVGSGAVSAYRVVWISGESDFGTVMLEMW